jgi:hypothetical protein
MSQQLSGSLTPTGGCEAPAGDPPVGPFIICHLPSCRRLGAVRWVPRMSFRGADMTLDIFDLLILVGDMLPPLSQR